MAKHTPSKQSRAPISKSKRCRSSIKKLEVKGNPPHIHNKKEGGYGTLKRRDYLEIHQPTRAEYADVQFVY
jgi:hypothetical protein